MKTVKIYHQVNQENKEASFAISRMEDIYVKRAGYVDEPHRHDYYTVVLVRKARATHSIDFKAYEMTAQQIYFIAPGQVHQIVEREMSEGYALTFSEQFLIENSIDLAFIDSLQLFEEYGQSPPLKASKEQFVQLESFAQEIETLFKGNARMKNLSIGAYLKLFLIECNNLCSSFSVDIFSEKAEHRILREFKHLVNKHFKEEHSTSFYAASLHISPDYLNRIVRGTIGKTAKEYIQSRIITETKRLLYFSKSTHKEIAYHLGFSEPANFSAFFKRGTGLTPTQFQKNMKS